MIKTIYLAGGCFWGVQYYFDNIMHITSTQVGYCQTDKLNITYEQTCSQIYNAVEVCEVQYDSSKISIEQIVEFLFRVIDPTSLNKQGNDVGVQYRAGIYYNDEKIREQLQDILNKYQEKYNEKIVVELEQVINYTKAEEYHQKYLEKNPSGYCHIDLGCLKFKEMK